MADSEPGSSPGLLRYFKQCRKNSCQISLPNPTGPLSEKVDSATIEEANREVTAVASTGGKRKRYLKLTDEQRATIQWDMAQPTRFVILQGIFHQTL